MRRASNILSAFTDGGYGNGGSGTSYSSPLVAGLAGILKASNPALTPDQIAAQIRSTADPIDNANPGYAGLLGRGRVNFARALSEDNPVVEVTAADRADLRRAHVLPSGRHDPRYVDAEESALRRLRRMLRSSASSSSGSGDGGGCAAAVSALAPGQTVQPGPFRFIVGSVTSATQRPSSDCAGPSTARTPTGMQ